MRKEADFPFLKKSNSLCLLITGLFSFLLNFIFVLVSVIHDEIHIVLNLNYTRLSKDFFN
jgi:hypothetical protein